MLRQGAAVWNEWRDLCCRETAWAKMTKGWWQPLVGVILGWMLGQGGELWRQHYRARRYQNEIYVELRDVHSVVKTRAALIKHILAKFIDQGVLDEYPQDISYFIFKSRFPEVSMRFTESERLALVNIYGSVPESGDPNGCPAASPLMRSKVRAYPHQGHGPRADQQAGYILATSDSTTSLGNGSRSIHKGRLEPVDRGAPNARFCAGFRTPAATRPATGSKTGV